MNKLLLLAVVALVPFTAAEAQKKNLVTNKGEIVPMEKYDSAATKALIDTKLNKTDTTGKWIGSLYKRNDSLFYKKNTAETFFSTIVSEAITPGLGQVTDVDNFSIASISVPSLDVRDGTNGINIYGNSGYPLTLLAPNVSVGGRTQFFPNASGTIALTSDVSNVYNSDGTLISDRQITGNNKSLVFNGVKHFKFNSSNDQGFQALDFNTTSSEAGLLQAFNKNVLISQGKSVNTLSGENSYIQLYRDSLILAPLQGNLYIDTINRSSSGSCLMVVWDSVAKRTQVQTLPLSVVNANMTFLPLAGGTLTGNLLFSADNTKDIGASGATRPRTGYFGTSIVTPSANITSSTGILSNGSNGLRWGGGYAVLSSGNGAGDVMQANTSRMDVTGSLLSIGGTTSSFPALKRSADTLKIRLADDSGDGKFTAGTSYFTGNVGIGTTSPTAKLEVTGNATTGNDLLITNSTLTSGTAAAITLTGTAAASNTKTGLAISSSGANATASQTVTGQTISVTNTGTSSTNVGLNVTASGASKNYDIVAGTIGLGGVTSSFPMIKRNSAAIDLLLADGSDYTVTNGRDWQGWNSGINKTYIGGAGALQVVSNGYFGISSSTTNVFSGDVFLNRQSAGVFGVGTSSSNALGTIVAANVGIGTTSPTAALHIATNGAASTPAGRYNGTWFTGGTATTTKPQLLIEPTSATSTNWSTSGTGLGINAASGFTGNLIDAQVNGASSMRLTSDFMQLGEGTMVYPSTYGFRSFSSASGASSGANHTNTSSTGYIQLLLAQTTGNYGGFFKWNSGYGGNYTSTNLPFASSFQLQAGSSNNQPLVLSGSKIVFQHGTTGTNLALSSSSTSIKIGTNADAGTDGNSYLDVIGAVGAAIATTTTNLTLDGTHHTVIVTGGTPTITLPAAASGNNRRFYRVVNQTGSAVTISSYLDFAGASATTVAANSAILIQSNGTNWYRVQ